RPFRWWLGATGRPGLPLETATPLPCDRVPQPDFTYPQAPGSQVLAVSGKDEFMKNQQMRRGEASQIFTGDRITQTDLFLDTGPHGDRLPVWRECCRRQVGALLPEIPGP